MDPAYRVERVPDAEAFLSLTAPLRAAEPYLTNVLATVAQGVVDGRRYDGEDWWVVRDPAGRVRGAAARTRPHPLQLSPMPVEAARELGRATAGDLPPGAYGTREVVTAYAAGTSAHLGARSTETLYLLGELVTPAAVPGAPRQASAAEFDTLVAWHEQFARDADVPAFDMPSSVRGRLAFGGLWWWCVGDVPVALAGHAQPIDGPHGPVGRVGPVFTPAAHRRQGYGAAITAHVSGLLARRCSTVLLYADAANPTSNGVYRRLGFLPEAEIVEVELHPD